MGTLKTLGQISEYLTVSNTGGKNERRVADKSRAASSTVEKDITAAGDSRQNDVVATMLEVVSQLTGYPVEMLGLDMDIEAELGIDSIKRVEILSAVEEKMPDLPPVSPEIMGTLKTLGQIADYLADSDDGQSVEVPVTRPVRAANGTDEENISTAGDSRQNDVVATMLEVVSQLTGYPVEMLGLDMDIEAELGIDSIKRVEILSAVEEKMPDLPAVSPEIMGTLKTLGQIADYLAGPTDLKAAPEKIFEAPATDSAPAADDDDPPPAEISDRRMQRADSQLIR
jgi:acyl carrier protein